MTRTQHIYRPSPRGKRFFWFPGGRLFPPGTAVITNGGEQTEALRNRPRCLGFGYGTSNRMYVMAFNDSSLPPVLPEDAAPLVATVAGSVLLPGDAGYDDERAVWYLNHEWRPR
jgi:hypothetical protein